MKTITADSCSRADVEKAFTQAVGGDRIVLPAGSAVWSESLRVSPPPDVSLIGAGETEDLSVVGSSDASVIVDNIDRSGYDAPLLEASLGVGGFRMAGITFKDSGNQNMKSYAGMIRVFGSAHQLRIDHNHFDHLSIRSLFIAGDIWGVVDRNLVDLNGQDQFIRTHGHTEGDPQWAEESGIGTERFVFVEDNIFTNPEGFAQINDAYEGGRFVIRYNKSQNAAVQTHPTGGSGRARGARSWEVYKNEITATVNNFNFFFMSSGTGVVWGNSVPTGFSHFITMHSMRVNTSTYTQAPVPDGWGQYKSVYDNEGTALDQPGTGICDRLFGSFPWVRNAATGAMTPDPNVNPRQKIDPVYIWDNTWTSSGGGQLVAVYEPDVLKQGTHYILGPKPGYTPYVYPHPLVSSIPVVEPPIVIEPPIEPPVIEPPPVEPPSENLPPVILSLELYAQRQPIDPEAPIRAKQVTITIKANDDTGVVWQEILINELVVKGESPVGGGISYLWHTSPYKRKSVRIKGLARDAEGLITTSVWTVTVI